jgi:hypothetical protein
VKAYLGATGAFSIKGRLLGKSRGKKAARKAKKPIGR